MPKITKHNGPSYKGEPRTQAPEPSGDGEPSTFGSITAAEGSAANGPDAVSVTTACPACANPAVDVSSEEVDQDGNRSVDFDPCGHRLEGEAAEAFIADTQNYPASARAVAVAALGNEGGEEPSPGSSSPTSSEEPAKKSGNSSTPNRSRAQTTANRSKKTPKGTSTARSTDGPTSSN